jgi:hypothetical protein
MKAPERLSPDDLRQEAEDLKTWLDRYLEDRDFLAGNPNHHLLYFIDAHDLKSFLEPAKLQTAGEGFTLRAELAWRGCGTERFKETIKLKNDQIIGDLVLDRRFIPAGLLPTHLEELIDELAFQTSLESRRKLNLLRVAEREIARLKRDPLTRTLVKVADHGAMTREFRAGVLKFIRKAAPALHTLLRRNPDTTEARMQRLTDGGTLRLPPGIDWQRFGFRPHDCLMLQTFTPDDVQVQAWRRYLTNRRTPGSTYRSNRVDAAAIAWIQGLNARLATIALPRVQAVLVTRARGLSRLVTDQEATLKEGLAPADFLRHPRLTVLNSSKAALHDGKAATDQPERVLAVALDAYCQQIIPRSAANSESDDWAASAIEPLVDAFHAFEEARLAIGLRGRAGSQDDDDGITDEDVRKMLRHFQNDGSMVPTLKDWFLTSVQDFGEAIVRLRTAGVGGITCLTWTVDGPPARQRVLPLIETLLAPIDFPALEVPPAPATITDLGTLIGRLAGGAPGREGWSYVGWGLLLACEANLAAARIYTSSALAIARVLDGDTSALTREARLLQQQIRRMQLFAAADGGVGVRHDATELADPGEASDVADPRGRFDRAARRLELFLRGAGSQVTGGWTMFRNDIEAACDADRTTLCCALALGLAGALAVDAHPARDWVRDNNDLDTVTRWHTKLHTLMSRTAATEGHRKHLPLIARCMELIGFQMQASAALPHAAAPQLHIPADLRLQVLVIAREHPHPAPMAATIEQRYPIAALVLAKLHMIADHLAQHLQRDLIKAPIWVPYAANRITALIADPSAREAARKAYELMQRVAGASQRIGVFEHDRADLERIGELFGQALQVVALSAAAGDPIAKRASYFLSMERCYARLLLAELAPKSDQAARWTELESEYQAISLQFPEASIPHFRLNVIYSLLGQRDADETRELALAVVKIGADSLEVPQDHWIHSTILRRSINLRLRRMEGLRQAGLNGDADAREQYVAAYVKAVRELRQDYEPTAPHPGDYLYSLERKRRINNIVYYASLLLEMDHDGVGLADAGLTRPQLRQFLQSLHPDGIRHVPEENIVHTVGFAYFQLGLTEEAREAGQRLRQMVLDNETVDVEAARKLLSEAANWTTDADRPTWADRVVHG